MSRAGVVVYPRVEKIYAVKPDGSRWVHKFSRRAAILGNRDGSLSIRAENSRTRLHRLFDYEGRKEPFLINPPRARRNAWSEEPTEQLRMFYPRNESAPAEKRYVYKAPRHQAAARKSWGGRVAELERGAGRKRFGLAKRVRRGAEPRNLKELRVRRQKWDMGLRHNPLQILNPPRDCSVCGVVDGQTGFYSKPVQLLRTADGYICRDCATSKKKVFQEAAGLFEPVNKNSRGKTMRRGKMPPGLARYWAARRRNPKRRAAAKGRAGARRRLVLKENPMAKRRRKAAKNYGSRRRSGRRARHNPPMFRGGPEAMSVVKDGAAVAGGILIPQLALRAPQLAKFADTPVKRALTKAAIGIGLSMLARKFVGPRIANMLLVGTASNILIADVLPKAAPGLGLGMADAYDSEQFPTLAELQIPQLEGGGQYGRPDFDLAEMATY